MWKRFSTGEFGNVLYAEGEYVHDCASVWPQISYGDKTHWRNRMYPTFYCTHSLGPILTITGRRPVKVTGYETPPIPHTMALTGRILGSGVEMVTLDNGAVVKSLHGGLKREPAENFYRVYGERGVLESRRYHTGPMLHVYKEDENKLCRGAWERYDPQNEIQPELVAQFPSHGGSDFYATYAFIQKILGKPDGKWSIGVYQAVDMGICGILAWRSCLAGGIPMDVPDLSRPEERERYRNDHACTNPAVAGDQLLPVTSYNMPAPSDEVYDRIRQLWENGLDLNGDEDRIYKNL